MHGAINGKLGARAADLHLRVKPENIKITVKTTKDGRALFTAKIRADGRTRAAKKFNTTATFRGSIDVTKKAPTEDAVRLAAFYLSKKPERANASAKQNWFDAKDKLTVAPQSAERVTFFSGNVPAQFNNAVKKLK